MNCNKCFVNVFKWFLFRESLFEKQCNRKLIIQCTIIRYNTIQWDTIQYKTKITRFKQKWFDAYVEWNLIYFKYQRWKHCAIFWILQSVTITIIFIVSQSNNPHHNMCSGSIRQNKGIIPLCLPTTDGRMIKRLALFIAETWWRYDMEMLIALLTLCVGNHWLQVDSLNKGQWYGVLIFWLLLAWTSCWNNYRVF